MVVPSPFAGYPAFPEFRINLTLTPITLREEALKYMAGAEGVFEWLMNQS